MNGGRLAALLLAAAAALALQSVAAAQERAPPERAADEDATSEDEDPAAEDNPAAAEDEDPTAEDEDSAADAGGAPASSAADDEVPYTVECGPDPETGGNVCLVDRDTYVGWRTFHSVCHTCHAQDAVGSTFAPDLLPRIRMIDKERFIQVVDQGFTGQVGVMPGWGMNPNVNKYYDELWSYLRARADGVLAPGRPKRLPDSN